MFNAPLPWSRILRAATLLVLAVTTFNSNMCAQKSALFTAFQQQCENNCVSVALIKAAMGTFGVTQVYERLPTTSSQLDYRLKDRDNVVLTEEELKAAIAHTGFRSDPVADPQIRAYADTCFAIMVKRNMHLNAFGTYQCALDALNNGYTTALAGPLLGVALEPIRRRRPKHLKTLQHIIIHNTYHTVYASEGLYDETGNTGPARIGALRWKRAGWKTGFGIRGLSGAYRIVEVVGRTDRSKQDP